MEIKTTMEIWKNPHLFEDKRWVAVDDEIYFIEYLLQAMTLTKGLRLVLKSRLEQFKRVSNGN